MDRPEIRTYFFPDHIMELTGIASDDLLKGTWRHGVNDPRIPLDELRRWFWDRHNSEDQIGDDRELYHHGADLIQMALGAAITGELRSDSPTLRFIFAIIEKREESKAKSTMPGPFFTQAFQILLLATKPSQREAVMKAVLEATGASR